MPKPRSSQVALDATPYYHCVSRCVRRAFLCGVDQYTNISYEHRRGWIEDKLLTLPNTFTIDVCAYAIMSNHYHVVFHVDQAAAATLSPLDVVNRWHQLFNGNDLSQRFARHEPLSEAEKIVLNAHITTWRERLSSISWFMRVLNESIARQANEEDKCTGSFWEGRFKSQALLDEQALAACMAYVDLNPLRACMANTPESSDYTSAQKRINHARTQAAPNSIASQKNTLFPFAGNPRNDMPKGLPFKLTDYLSLLDETARIQRDDKRGYMSSSTSPILDRLDLSEKVWLEISQQFEERFKTFAGNPENIRQIAKLANYQRAPGIANAAPYYT